MEAVVTPGHEVLIVGAGPTGLTAAAELYTQGVACRVIDAAPERRAGSRGLAIHSRTLEVFEDMGVLEPILAHGLRVYGFNAWAEGQRIIHVGFDELDSPYPFILTLPQAETERILEDHLMSLGGAVERPVTLTGLEQTPDHVTATLEHADGRAEQARCGWLLGCDGAKSAVRRGLGAEFAGASLDHRLLLADLTVDWAQPHDEIHAFLAPEGAFLAIPLPGKGRCRLIAQAPLEGEAEPTLAWFEACIAARTGAAAALSDPTWFASLEIEERIAADYRHGRVLLAGDAAHVHSPVGGQGMNLGVQDAFNLAWKLGLTIRHQALPALLESYPAERRPIASQVINDTSVATRVVMLRHPVGQALRNNLGSLLCSLEVVQRRATHQIGDLAFNYRYSPLVGEERSSILTASVHPDASSERPNLRNWLDFGAAPYPGDRAPDVAFRSGAEGETRRAFELIRGPHHTLLLFDGWAPTEQGYENLADIARRVRQVYGPRVTPLIVVPQAAAPEALTGCDCEVVLDPSGAFHARYGAGAECLYLIRPDNYVAFRAQPASERPLWTYLQRLFPCA